ncbi:hypothetical protein Pfo_000397, partial [Paulownia fortunei]
HVIRLRNVFCSLNRSSATALLVSPLGIAFHHVKITDLNKWEPRTIHIAGMIRQLIRPTTFIITTGSSNSQPCLSLSYTIGFFSTTEKCSVLVSLSVSLFIFSLQIGKLPTCVKSDGCLTMFYVS